MPISVRTIDLFDATYDETLSQAIESAKQAGAIAEDDKAIEEVVSEDEGKTSKSWSMKALDALGATTEAITSGISKATTAAMSGASSLVAWAKVVLTQVTEGYAVLLVTSCVIPIAMPLVAYWFVKIFFQPSGSSVAVVQLPMLQSGQEALPAGDMAELEG